MLRAATEQDWRDFLRLAAAEGWRMPQVEERMFRGPWVGRALALHEDGFCGLVTAACHPQSGWIGNLIVSPERRRQGHGRRLFEAAVKTLLEDGVKSLWLTASAAGQGLYEQAGFVVVDHVERWIRVGGRGIGAEVNEDDQGLWRADREVWGEERILLLQELTATGRVSCCGDSVALLQDDGGMQIIGPWYGGRKDDDADLLSALLNAAAPGRELVVDLLASSFLQAQLAAAGFVCHGTTRLMTRGGLGTARRRMMALGSLGSIG